MTALAVLQGIGATASIISGAKNIFDPAHDRIEEALDSALTALHQLWRQIATASADILEAIEGVRRALDEDVALDAITLADTALFNDLGVFNDKQAAITHSLEASHRLYQETDEVFVSSFV
ncbi:hypothetical protein JBE04_08860 [Streptomyces sp. PRKS01-29]|nr:hypothetical protein [Streptomyces sabulosicollis]MBI0294589.1 hypothetical protein [Streptomyces sabulosicollis]